jgi:hypothetical protein
VIFCKTTISSGSGASNLRLGSYWLIRFSTWAPIHLSGDFLNA